MRIKDTWYLVAPEYETWDEAVAEAELSKAGLADFHERYDRRLIVQAIGADMGVALDMEGTWPAHNNPNAKPLAPTGAYRESRPGRKKPAPDEFVFVQVGIAIFPDLVSAFEEGEDLAGCFEDHSEAVDEATESGEE